MAKVDERRQAMSRNEEGLGFGGTVMVVGVIAPILMAMVTPSIIWQGYVLTRLWAWFVVPMGAPHLSLMSAVGASIIVNMFREKASADKETPELKKSLTDHVLQGYVGPLLRLAFGWAAHSWL